MSNFLGTVTRLARNVLAVMQPATGSRASGTVTLTAAASTTVSIPRNTFAYPVIDGRHRPDMLFKTDEGPESDGSWLVPDTGLAVGFISNTGGIKHNLPAGTAMEFFPPILGGFDGSPVVVDVGGFTGATSPDAFGCLQEAVIYETFDGPARTLDLRRSDVRAANGRPFALVAWQDTQPADGSTIAQTRRETRASNTGTLYKTTFSVSIITARSEQDMLRRAEGMAAMDLVARLLTDRHSVDGDACFSNPSGLQIRQMFRESGPQDVYQKFYIYTIIVSAMHILQGIDSRTFNDWLLAVLNVDKPDETLGPIRIVNDNRIDMS